MQKYGRKFLTQQLADTRGQKQPWENSNLHQQDEGLGEDKAFTFQPKNKKG